jgi:N-acetylneuraminic acid mutarotase
MLTTNVIQEYDPSSNTWSTKSSSGFTARQLLATAVVNGKIYALGGDTFTNGAIYTNINEQYDPATNTWSTKSSAGFSGRRGHAAAEANGRIYVLGGSNSGGLMSAIDEYNPETNSWSTKSSTGFTPRIVPVAAVVNGKIYTLGGEVINPNGPSPVLLNTNEEYTPADYVYLHVKQ